jgi:tetratricopeptide (TPR) repeat protein
MSKMYRVRLKNGKILGPLDLQEIKVAIISKKIFENNDYQIYPNGTWANINTFSEIVEYLKQENQIEEHKEKTILLKIESLFNVSEINEVEAKTEKIESDQTVGENDPTALKQEINELKSESVTRADTQLDESEVDPDSTQFINIKNLTQENAELVNDVDEVLKEEKIAQLKKKQKQIEEINEVLVEDNEDEDVAKKSKRKKLVIFLVAVLLAFVLLTPDKPKDVKKQFTAIKFTYSFPIENPKINIQESEKIFKQGLEILSLKTYESLVNASKYFLKSIEQNYKDNPALPKLILSYVDLMPFVNNSQVQTNVVFQLIQVFYQKYYSDVDVNNAHGMFYYNINKSETAYKIMKSYLERGNSPSLRYFADLIRICLKSGKFAEATELYGKLKSQKIVDPYIFSVLYEYEMLNNNSTEAINWIKQGLEIMPTSVMLMLKKAEFDIYSEDYVSLEITLKLISDNLFESSEYYQIKYFELMGVLALVSGKNSEAQMFFEKASSWERNESLYMRLAGMDEKKIPEAAGIILKARALKFVHDVHQNLNSDNLNLALLNATNAIDIDSKLPEAVIALCLVEKRMGFYEKAINRLEILRENNPLDAESNFTLLATYIEAYKFSDAIKLFNIVGASSLREDYRFFSLNGLMNFKMNKLLESAQAFQGALEKNPLNDKDFYYLAEIYFKRKMFNNSKSAYTKAMELNPSETLYRVSYSRILYEESGADVAIGYLRDQMNDFKNDPLILGEIAILYYQTGQVAYFEDVFDQIKQLPKKNSRMYEFLIKHSSLNEKFDDVIKFTNELLAIEPGDIQARMSLAELLIELKKFDESLEHLFYIRDRLSTYPKLLYNISRLNLLAGKKEQALDYAKQEVAANPGLEDGHILLGNILKDQNDLLSAENHFRESLRINPNSVEGLSGMAFVSVKRNNLDAALDMYQKAVTLAPNNPMLRKSIADVYRLTGQSALAIDNYKVYLDLMPDSSFKTEIDTYIRNFE